MKPTFAEMQAELLRLYRRGFPTLGDSARTFPVELTEPEINGICAFVAFTKAACSVDPFTRFWEHYGPTMQALSDRLT